MQSAAPRTLDSTGGAAHTCIASALLAGTCTELTSELCALFPRGGTGIGLLMQQDLDPDSQDGTSQNKVPVMSAYNTTGDRPAHSARTGMYGTKIAYSGDGILKRVIDGVDRFSSSRWCQEAPAIATVPCKWGTQCCL